MDSQNLKQRATVDSTDADAAARNDDDVDKKQRAPRRERRKRRITKRGLSSLAAAALAVPAGLTVLAVRLGSANAYYPKTTPFWFPAPWAVHAASAGVMGLAAWLVWAEGGFHASPLALYLYLVQLGLGLGLGLAWDTLVFGAEAGRAGLVLCLGLFGSLVGCHQAFKSVNPQAAQLVKPCLAWTAFLALVNLSLVYL